MARDSGDGVETALGSNLSNVKTDTKILAGVRWLETLDLFDLRRINKAVTGGLYYGVQNKTLAHRRHPQPHRS